MGFTVDRLYELLPAIYRIRDIAQGDAGNAGGPLKELLGVIARETAILEANLAQLYEDQFIETCSEWVVPYLGDLLGVDSRQLNSSNVSQRAVIANTLAYRRRKGTVMMLEQLAREISGWDAHVVEFFRRLAITQSIHHIQPKPITTVNLREWEPLERLNTPFDEAAHTVDVRNISDGSGRYNIPNIGIFLWRLRAYQVSEAPAYEYEGDPLRYTFHPLGVPMQLFTFPATGGEYTGLSGPLDVPMPISRRLLEKYMDSGYYGRERSFYIEVKGKDIMANHKSLSEVLHICNLNDMTDSSGTVIGWQHMPAAGGKIALDPETGRLAFPSDQQPSGVRVTYSSGFSMNMGGGQYSRIASFDPLLSLKQLVNDYDNNYNLQAVIGSLKGSGAVEITTSNKYKTDFNISVPAYQRIELRAMQGVRPVLELNGDMQISGGEGAELILNGLLISGAALKVSGPLKKLIIRHCTLVPGLALDHEGNPLHPEAASLVVETHPGQSLSVIIEHSIVGPLQLQEGLSLMASDSIIYAPALRQSHGEQYNDEIGTAIAADLTTSVHGPECTLERVTVVGKMFVKELTLASNCLFTGPVTTEKRQSGCLRYSYVPEKSVTPKRYRCQPDLAVHAALKEAEAANPALNAAEQEQIAKRARTRLKPFFTQEKYGQPAFMQLGRYTPEEIRSGADDGSEMGAFHDVFQSPREANLRSQLDEYIKFGMEAGIFYET